MTAKILVAAADLHRIGLVHLDLKHENILLADNNQPVIADFGFARCARADAPAIAAALSHRASASAASSCPPSLRFTAGAQVSDETHNLNTHRIPACSEGSGCECHCAARQQVLSSEGLPRLPETAFGVKPRDISLGAFSPPQCWMPVSRVDGRKADGFAVGVLASYCLSQLGVGIDLATKRIVLADFAPGVSTAAIDFVRTATSFGEAERPLPEELLHHPWVAASVAEVLEEQAGTQQGCLRRWWEPVPATLEAETHSTTASNDTGESDSESVSDCDTEADVRLELGQEHELFQGRRRMERHSPGDFSTPAPKHKQAWMHSCNSLAYAEGTACNPQLPSSGQCTPLTSTQSDGDLVCSDGRLSVSHVHEAQALGKKLTFDVHERQQLARSASR